MQVGKIVRGSKEATHLTLMAVVAWVKISVNVLNLTRNSRLYSHHFHKEKISCMSGNPVYFYWNNRRTTLMQRRP